MTRRRVSCSSLVHTIWPPEVQAGTPGTISSQRGSVSSCSTWAWPLPGSTARIRIVRWSRLCTTTSGSCPTDQSAVTRYGNAAPPVSTVTLVPSSLTSSRETSAFGVPAAG